MSNILESCVCVALSLSKYSVQRKGDKNKVSSNADKKMITFGKKILASKELATIASFDSMVYEFMDWQKGRRSLPTKFLKDGVYLIPSELLTEVEAKLAEFKIEREKLINKFIASFESRINEAVALLGDEFRWADYPEYNPVTKRVDEIFLKEKFKMNWNIFILNIPETLKDVNVVLYEQQKKKIREQCLQAEQEIITLLRQEAVDFINGLVNRLKTNDDGSKKPLHKSYFDKFNDFLDNFQCRNIANDIEMSAAIEHCRLLLSQSNVATLQDDQSLRDTLRKQFEEAKKVIDAFQDPSLDGLDFFAMSDDEEHVNAA